MMARIRLLLGIATLLILSTGVLAQISAAPSLLNYQGRLAKPDGTPVPDGNYSIRFSLYTAVTGGTQKWTQTINPVSVKNGTFAVFLSGFSADTFDGDLWLQIKIGSDAALSPRQQLVSVAYAMKANSVPDGAIGTNQLADNAVTSAKIADGTITASDLASNALNNLTWLLSGNAASASHFLGTTNNQPLVFRTNNTEKMRLLATGSLGVGTTSPIQTLDVNGRMNVANGVIQRGGAALTSTSDLGLYSQISGNWMRFVTNNAPFYWFADSGSGTNALMTLSAGGNLSLKNPAGNQRSLLGYNGTTDAGYFQIFGPSNKLLAGLGGDTSGGQIFTNNGSGATTILMNGSSGELTAKVVVITGGSDVAEPYHIAPAGEVKPIPGYVVAIDPDKVGQMRVVSRAYDTTVAGIVSGANGINPGITLRQKGTVADGELPVASIGRVWCWCDADASGPIVAGDLLTTSDTPGHAMKASDRERRDGAVIGKAMSSLKSGKGLVLVLVSLK